MMFCASVVETETMCAHCSILHTVNWYKIKSFARLFKGGGV